MKRLMTCLTGVVGVALCLMGCGLEQQREQALQSGAVARQCTPASFVPKRETAADAIKDCNARCVASGVDPGVCSQKCAKIPAPRFESSRCFVDCIGLRCHDILSCSAICYQVKEKYPPRDTCEQLCLDKGIDAATSEEKCYKLDMPAATEPKACVDRCLAEAGTRERCEAACQKLGSR